MGGMGGVREIIKDEAHRKKLKDLLALKGSMLPWLDFSDIKFEEEYNRLEDSKIKTGRIPQIVDFDEF
jgi:hypothetical protein